jgi:hypothetical protein
MTMEPLLPAHQSANPPSASLPIACKDPGKGKKRREPSQEDQAQDPDGEGKNQEERRPRYRKPPAQDWRDAPARPQVASSRRQIKPKAVFRH